MSDKRASFFLVAAAASAALWPAAPHDFRNLTLLVAGVYVLLAVASWLDHHSRR